MEQTAILLLTANPSDKARLRVDREIRDIEDGLLRANNRANFIFKSSQAVRVPDLRRAMQRHKPQIVHFSGHGEGEAGLCFEDLEGRTQFVRTEALSNFFSLFSAQVQCVVLNACYSQVQAVAIAKHIDYVIGMSDSITDEAAIAFAVAFYESLGESESIESAYRLACSDIAMLNLKEEHIPKLIRRQQAPVPTATAYAQFSEKTVFLAECSDDLNAEREQLKIHLQQQNVRVLPEDLYFFPDAQALSQAVKKDLAQAELYIQLFNNTRPSRPPGMSTPLLQHQLATASGLPCLQWQAPDTKLDKELCEQFIPEPIIKSSLEEFKLHMDRQLRKRENRKAPEPSEDYISIFIDVSPEDLSLSEQVVQCLYEHGFDVDLPMFEHEDALTKMRDLEENLREADVILLIYHQASLDWIRQHLRQCRKAQRRRKNRHRLIAVCQDQPAARKNIGMKLHNMQVYHCADFQADCCLPALIGRLRRKA